MITNTIRVVRVAFIAVPNEHVMHYRPYRSRVNNETLTAIDQITEGGKFTNTERFSAISGRVVAPTTQSQGRIQLPYGWDTQRYSVMIEFDFQTPAGSTREIITGYTGYADLSHGGHLPPEMPIFTNSHTVARAKQYSDHGHRFTGYASMGSKQLLQPVHVQGLGGEAIESQAVLRPMDTLAHQQRRHYNLLSADTVDMRSSMRMDHLTSNRDNVIGSRYLSKIWNGYKAAMANNPDTADTGGYIMGAAADSPMVVETSAYNSAIFNRLKEYTSYDETFYVTWGEMLAAFPELNDQRLVDVFHPKQGALQSLTDTTQHWGGATLETQIAYNVVQAVPAMMSSLLLTNYAFSMDNRSGLGMEGMVNVVCTGFQFMVDLQDEVNRLQMMELSLKTDIANSVMAAGAGDFAVSMNCNVLGSNTVSVSVNGGPWVEFSAPSYCDSLFSPVVGEGPQVLDQLSMDLGGMLETIYQTPTHY